MMKRLHSTLFYASDLARAAEFYERLGFPVVKADDAVTKNPSGPCGWLGRVYIHTTSPFEKIKRRRF